MSAEMDPSPKRPDWLQVDFPCPRTIDRVAALCYLPAVNASPRDFEVQVRQRGTWRTVASGKNEWAWVLYRELAPVTTTALRLAVTGINDGWHGDRRWMHVLMGPEATHYTASKLLVAELEAYGPPASLEIKAAIAQPEKRAAFARDTVAVSVANRTGTAQRLTARVTVPEGWRANPAQLALALAARGRTAASFELLAPPRLSTGTIPIEVALVDANGRTVDVDRPELTVAPPVELAPQMPRAIDEARQRLGVDVRNMTGEPLRGTATLTLAPAGPPGGAGRSVRVKQRFGPVPPRGTAHVEFAVQGLTLVGSTWRATYTVEANRLLTSAEQTLALRGWQVLGPFPNEGGAGFAAVYGPEKGVDVAKTYAIAGRPAPVRWKPAMRDAAGFVDLTKLFAQTSNVCAYAYVCVRSPRARAARLSAGSDDGIKAWLNGRLVVSHDVQRGAAPGQETLAVALHEGWNEVLLKITQGHGGWGFYFDLLTPAGKPMADLVYAQKPSGP